MEEVQYLHELNIPANMLTIIKKLPYKFRDKWRSAACELQERHSRRATLIDITNFIERQVRILTDPVFGNIQDTPSLTNRGVNKANPQTRSAIKGTSFATTVAPAINRTQPGTRGKEHIESARRTCIWCGFVSTVGEEDTQREDRLLKREECLFWLFVYWTHQQSLQKTDFLYKMWSQTSNCSSHSSKGKGQRLRPS